MENQAELEEKTRLINQVLELQHTLEGAENLFSLSVSFSLYESLHMFAKLASVVAVQVLS